MLNFGPRPNSPTKLTTDTKVWHQSSVSDQTLSQQYVLKPQTTVMHLDWQLSLIPRVKALVLKQRTSTFALVLNESLRP